MEVIESKLLNKYIPFKIIHWSYIIAPIKHISIKLRRLNEIIVRSSKLQIYSKAFFARIVGYGCAVLVWCRMTGAVQLRSVVLVLFDWCGAAAQCWFGVV